MIISKNLNIRKLIIILFFSINLKSSIEFTKNFDSKIAGIFKNGNEVLKNIGNYKDYSHIKDLSKKEIDEILKNADNFIIFFFYVALNDFLYNKNDGIAKEKYYQK